MQYISCSYIQLLIIKWMQVQKCSVHFDRYPLWDLCSLSLSLFIFSFTLFYHKRCQMVGDGESVWGVTTHRDKCLSNALSLFSLSFHSNSQTTGALRSVLWLLLCSYIKNVFFWYLFVCYVVYAWCILLSVVGPLWIHTKFYTPYIPKINKEMQKIMVDSVLGSGLSSGDIIVAKSETNLTKNNPLVARMDILKCWKWW